MRFKDKISYFPIIYNYLTDNYKIKKCKGNDKKIPLQCVNYDDYNAIINYLDNNIYSNRRVIIYNY